MSGRKTEQMKQDMQMQGCTLTRESVALRKLAGRKAWRSMLPIVLLQPVRTTIASTSSS